MAIEVWDGTTWIVKTDPEICTAINPTTGAGTFTNINKGEVFVGPNSNDWTTFYNRITSNTPPTLTLVSKGSKSITIRMQTSSSEYKKVFAFISGDLSTLQSYPASATASSINTTFTFSGLTPNQSYTFIGYIDYYDAQGDYVETSSTSSLTISTYPLHTPKLPVKSSATDTSLVMETDINAYNNGNAKIQWEYQYSTRGSNTWSGTITVLSSTIVTGTSTSDYTQAFTVIESREYRFRARVYYVDLGIYGPYSNGGAFTGAIRGLTWTSQNTGWIFASSTTASDSASGYSPSMGSDGNQGSIWFSNPYHYQAGTATEFKTITAFARTASVGQNLYYLDSNHAISSSYPSIATSIDSLRYAVSSVSRDTTQSIYVVLTLNSATRCILQYADEVRIISTSNSAYVQDYYVASASGATVYLAPRGTTPANCSSSSGGTLIVYTSAGYGVGVFGGTSNYTSAADNYFARTDGDYGADVPLSVATGQASYTIPTSTKVSSRTTESFSANFTPTLPAGHRNAKLYQFSIRVGPTATPALSNIVVDGVYYGDLGSRTAYQSSTITPDVLNSPPYNISFDIDSAYYSGDGLYYATVTEVQAYITYEILEDI